MKALLKASGLLLILGILAIQAGFAQDSTDRDKKKVDVKQWVQEKDFVFVAQSMIPARRGIRQLTSYYDLLLNHDTLRSFLPYFGRSYTAPIGQTKSPLDFTSTDFKYTVEDRKRGGYEITIEPQDVRNVQQFYLTVFDNGSASLRVNSNDREAISFNGYITKKEEK